MFQICNITQNYSSWLLSDSAYESEIIYIKLGRHTIVIYTKFQSCPLWSHGQLKFVNRSSFRQILPGVPSLFRPHGVISWHCCFPEIWAACARPGMLLGDKWPWEWNWPAFVSWKVFWVCYIDGLVQERRNSSALAMEWRLSCTNPSI